MGVIVGVKVCVGVCVGVLLTSIVLVGVIVGVLVGVGVGKPHPLLVKTTPHVNPLEQFWNIQSEVFGELLVGLKL